MKIIVDRDRCEANGVCTRLAPSVFRLDDNDQLHIQVAAELDAEQRAAIEKAVRLCPKAALAITQADQAERNPR